MTNVIPVKGYFVDNQLTTLGEFEEGDTISNEYIDGITINNDVTSNNITYPLLSTANSGTLSSATVSAGNLYYNASEGMLTAKMFNSLSDVTLKENISPITNSIEVLNSLNPVKYNWKNSNKKSYGLIAQELEEILPELVTETNGIKSIDYLGIIGILIKAIQELTK